MEEELLGIFGWVRSKDVTGLAVLPGVSGEVLCRVVSSSDNRGFAPISEQMLDLLRLCSDFDV